MNDFGSITLVTPPSIIDNTNKTFCLVNFNEDDKTLFMKYIDKFYKNTKESLIYIDTIYNPSQTKMIKHFKLSNIKTYNGLSMFIYQGQKSFYLWNKINPEVDDGLLQLLESKLSL